VTHTRDQPQGAVMTESLFIGVCWTC
jgi:hypothetical protein